MSWFKKAGPRTAPATGQHAHRIESEDVELACASCGAVLGFDREDEPDGAGPGLHLCGECSRQRNFDAEVEMVWFSDRD